MYANLSSTHGTTTQAPACFPAHRTSSGPAPIVSHTFQSPRSLSRPRFSLRCLLYPHSYLLRPIPLYSPHTKACSFTLFSTHFHPCQQNSTHFTRFPTQFHHFTHISHNFPTFPTSHIISHTPHPAPDRDTLIEISVTGTFTCQCAGSTDSSGMNATIVEPSFFKKFMKRLLACLFASALRVSACCVADVGLCSTAHVSSKCETKVVTITRFSSVPNSRI